MTRDELEMVADHLGHSVNIHTGVYKMQQNLIERSKVALVLSGVENGLYKKTEQKVYLDTLNISDLGEFSPSCSSHPIKF